jgi:magnesium transporter
MSVAAIVYSEGAGVRAYDDIHEAKAAAGTTWVRVAGGDREEFDAVADAFGLHPLNVEDVVNDVRPKTEEFPDYTFFLIKGARLAGGERAFDEEVRERPIGVFIGSDWVVTLSVDPIAAVGRVWETVERGDERLLQRGPDFTAYRVADVIVDEYFDLLDRIESDIEEIEEEVLVSTDIETLERINDVRRDLLAFRKVAWPTREAIGVLARGDPVQIQDRTEKYYRDVYDHLVQVVDLTETYRDLTRGARDIYLNTLSQSTNEVMKRLTVVAVNFLPLSFIAGLMGMNFTNHPANMPELAWPFAYPAVLLGMTLVAAILLVYFREQGYI